MNEFEAALGADYNTSNAFISDEFEAALGANYSKTKPKSMLLTSGSKEKGVVGDIFSGLKVGSEFAIANTIESAQALAKELYIDIPKEAEDLKQFFSSRAMKTIHETPTATTPFKKRPIRKTIFNVASAAPMMAAAYATTLITKKPVLGAALFGPPTLGSYYREGLAAGKEHEELFGPALTNSVAQVLLETIPLTGVLKGGTIGKRIGRAVLQEGIIEEGSQQVVENTLKAFNWKGFEDFVPNLISDVTESVVAGSVMGAGMGAISPVTINDVKADAQQAAKKHKKRLAEKARHEGKPETEIQEILASVDMLVEDMFLRKTPKAYREATAKNISKNPNLLKAKYAESSVKETREYINDTALMPDGARRAAHDLVIKIDPQWGTYPTVLQDKMLSFVGKIAEEAHFTSETLEEAFNDKKVKDWFLPNKIYVSGAGKKSKGNIDPDTKVWHPLYSGISIKDLAFRLKFPDGEILKYSINPVDHIVISAYMGKSELGSKARVTLALQYKNLRGSETFPVVDDVKETAEETVDLKKYFEPETPEKIVNDIVDTEIEKIKAKSQAGKGMELFQKKKELAILLKREEELNRLAAESSLKQEKFRIDTPARDVTTPGNFEVRYQTPQGIMMTTMKMDDLARLKENIEQGTGEIAGKKVFRIVEARRLAMSPEEAAIVDSQKPVCPKQQSDANTDEAVIEIMNDKIESARKGITTKEKDTETLFNTDTYEITEGIFLQKKYYELLKDFAEVTGGVDFTLLNEVQAQFQEELNILIPQLQKSGHWNSIYNILGDLAYAPFVPHSAEFIEFVNSQTDVLSAELEKPKKIKEKLGDGWNNIHSLSDLWAPSQLLVGMEVRKPVEIIDVSGNPHIISGCYGLVPGKDIISLRLGEVNIDISKAEAERIFSEHFAAINRGEDPPFIFGNNPAFGGKAVNGLSEEEMADKERFSAISGSPIQTVEYNNNPRTLPARALTNVMKWSRFPSGVKTFLESFFGKKNFQKVLEKKPTLNLKDEIVSVIYADKAFKRLASHMAWDQTRPVHEDILRIAEEKSSVEGKVDKQRTEQLYDNINFAMQLAAEEIYSEHGKDGQFAITKIGVGGKHEPPQAGKEQLVVDGRPINNPERYYYGQHIKMLHDIFNLPYTEADLSRWAQGRDFLSFFKLLKKIDPQLQKALVWTKAEIEQPLLEAQTKEGVFQNANMWDNISKGYAHRVFVMEEPQDKMTGPKFNTRSSFDSMSYPAADYRTTSESIGRTAAQGMKPVLGLIASQQEYIKESLIKLQQVQTLGILAKLAPEEKQIIKGFEDNMAVNNYIAKTRYVEYTDSPMIKKIAEATGNTVQSTLMQLGYAQSNYAPGLTKWSKGTFQVPYMTKELNDFATTVLEPKDFNKGTLGAFNKVTNYFKRLITFQPFDSTFLWLTPVIVNSPLFVLEIPGLMYEQAKVVFRGAKEGVKILHGKEWLKETDIIGPGYENLPLFMKSGFTAVNYEQAMAAIWDKEVLGKFPELRSPWENIKEYVGSVGGTNKAIFQHLIAKKLYHVINKRYEQFVKKGMSQTVAARRAVKLVNDTSFMLSPDIWGKEGKYFTALFFTRNLTVGFIRQITGVMHPIAQVFGIKHKNTPGAIYNSLIHGEASQADMDFLAKYYATHLMKTILAGTIVNGLIQYALSFIDDEEPDEHGGEKFMGVAKKRLMYFNEGGKKFSVRTPWKEHTNRRTYIDFQLLREARHIGNVLFDGLENVPANMIHWGRNRFNVFINVGADMLWNIDHFSGKRLISYPDELSWADKSSVYGDYFKDRMTPLGLGIRPEEKGWTGDPKLDKALTLLEWFGASKRYGQGMESGALIKELKVLRTAKAEEAYSQERIKKDVRWMTATELTDLVGPDYSVESYKREILRRLAPYMQDLKQNKRALMKYYQRR